MLRSIQFQFYLFIQFFNHFGVSLKNNNHFFVMLSEESYQSFWSYIGFNFSNLEH